MTPAERDLYIRVTAGEAGNQDDLGNRAVAHVIYNRSAAARQPIADVIRARGQFEPMGNPTTRASLMSMSTSDPRYQRAAAAVDAVIGGQSQDPTGGATHFYSPEGQRAQGRLPPRWDNGRGTDIGGHRFFRLGYSAMPVDPSIVAGTSTAGAPAPVGGGALSRPAIGATPQNSRTLAQQSRETLQREFPNLRINSTDRNPAQNAAAGGARGSRHTHGDATDWDVSRLTPEERQAFLNRNYELGARGFGLYRSGRVVHTDFRANPMVWGTGANQHGRISPEQALPQDQSFAARVYSGGARAGGTAAPGGTTATAAPGAAATPAAAPVAPTGPDPAAMLAMQQAQAAPVFQMPRRAPAPVAQLQQPRAPSMAAVLANFPEQNPNVMPTQMQAPVADMPSIDSGLGMGLTGSDVIRAGADPSMLAATGQDPLSQPMNFGMRTSRDPQAQGVRTRTIA